MTVYQNGILCIFLHVYFILSDIHHKINWHHKLVNYPQSPLRIPSRACNSSGITSHIKRWPRSGQECPILNASEGPMNSKFISHTMTTMPMVGARQTRLNVQHMKYSYQSTHKREVSPFIRVLSIGPPFPSVPYPRISQFFPLWRILNEGGCRLVHKRKGGNILFFVRTTKWGATSRGRLFFIWSLRSIDWP